MIDKHERAALAATSNSATLLSAEAGGELCERVVDSEETGGGHVFDRDPFGERNLGRSVGARSGVLLVDGGQAFRWKAISDTNESRP
jgi:hypothetical protein